MNQLFTKALPITTNLLVEKFQHSKPDFLSSFYLSGGTALALQIGHRQSEDLDFFAQTTFDPLIVQSKLESFGKLNNTEIAEGTLNTFVEKVKLQFLEYPYPLLHPTLDWNGIQLSSVQDIACTKLQTVSMRGSKKDFIDLYFLLKEYSLRELFDSMQQKYQQVEYNQAHILKSLVYFVNAEDQPMPRMMSDLEWPEVKKQIIEIVKKFEFK